DITPPTDPTDLATASLPTDTTPDYTWTASDDLHSELAAYEIYWALASAGSCAAAAPNQDDEAGESFTLATPLTGGAADYRICVRARDKAGNTSGWAEDVFTFTPP
ncbi:MAG: hypothetical protein MUO76_07185, partial [Anaerolineaceae bacterium]|nr:hypothetical protein [Anaerolineaceae bacterium]